MYEFIRSLRDDIGKDVRMQFFDERGDFTFDGKIESISSDGRILIFAHNPLEAEKMNAKQSKINLSAVIIRGVDYLTMPTVDKMKKVEKDAIAKIPCPSCKTRIFILNPDLQKEDEKEEQEE